MQALLRAMLAAHVPVRLMDTVRVAASVVVAALGIMAAFVPRTASVITAIGAAWAFIYSVQLASSAAGASRQAALLQEMFDVRLFDLPWNAVVVGTPLGAEEVNRLAKRYRGAENEVRDYYEIPELPRPYDVIACQQQNLGWGSRVRRRYGQAVLAGVAVWSCAGLLVGALAGLTVVDLILRFYVPSLSVILLGLETYRAQREVTGDRERVLGLLRTEVAAAVGGARAGTEEHLLVIARQAQDVIFRTRERNARVPNWFFTRFRQADRADFEAAMRELATAVGVPPSP